MLSLLLTLLLLWLFFKLGIGLIKIIGFLLVVGIMFFFFAAIPSTSYSTMPSWEKINFRIFPISQFRVLRTFVSILILTV